MCSTTMSCFSKMVVMGLAPFVFIYALIPFLIFCFPAFMQHMFFLNFVKVPFRDYSNLTSYGVRSIGRNFYMTGRDGVRIGCWHVLPAALSAELAGSKLTDDQLELTLVKSKYPVVIYLHGNSFDRSGDHRVRLYNVLSAMNFHIVTFDYRGYGDSASFPTEIGVVQDAKLVYRYVRKLAPDGDVFVWGHSMGTGVAAASVMELSESEEAPLGVVLEAPFNNLRDAIMHHPFSAPFRWLPYFDDILTHPLENSGLNMSSDLRVARSVLCATPFNNLRDAIMHHPFSAPFRWLPYFDDILTHPLENSGLNMSSDPRVVRITCPIMILHAEDDHIVAAILGRRLRDAALAARRDVTYVEFEASRQFKHKYIHTAHELPAIVTKFFKRCGEKKEK